MLLSVSIYLCRYRIIRSGLGSVRRRDQGEGRSGRGGGLFGELCQSQTQQRNAGCYYFVCGVVILISHLPLLSSTFSENIIDINIMNDSPFTAYFSENLSAICVRSGEE